MYHPVYVCWDQSQQLAGNSPIKGDYFQVANNQIEQRTMAPVKGAFTRRAKKNTRRGPGRRDKKGVAKHVTGSGTLASASSPSQDSTGERGEICNGGECESTATSVEQPKPSTQAALPISRMPAASHVQPPTASPEKCRGPRWNRRRGGQPARVDDILQQLAGGGLESVVAAARKQQGQAVTGKSDRPVSTGRYSKTEGHVRAESKGSKECSTGQGRVSDEHWGSGREFFEWPVRGTFQGLTTLIVGRASHSSCATSQDTVPSALSGASQDTCTSLTTSRRTSCAPSDLLMQLQGGDAVSVAGEASGAQEELNNINREVVCVGCSVMARMPLVASESDTQHILSAVGGVPRKTYAAAVCVQRAGLHGKSYLVRGSQDLGSEPAECGPACEGSEVLGSAPDVLPGVAAAMDEIHGGGPVVMELGHDKQEQKVKCSLAPGCSEVSGQSFVSCHFSSLPAQMALSGRTPEQSKEMQAQGREPLCSMSKDVSKGSMPGCLPGQSTAEHSIKSSVSKCMSTGPGIGCPLGQCVDLQGGIKESIRSLACKDHVAGGMLVQDTAGAKSEARSKISAGWDLDFLDLEDDEDSYMETLDPAAGKQEVVAGGGTRLRVVAQQQMPEEPLHVVTMQTKTEVGAEANLGFPGGPCGSGGLQPAKEVSEKGAVNAPRTLGRRQETYPSLLESLTVSSGVRGKKCEGKSVVVEGANSATLSPQPLGNTQDRAKGRRALAVRPATSRQARRRANRRNPEQVGKVKKASPRAMDQIGGGVTGVKAGSKFVAAEETSLQGSFPGTALELQDHLDDLLADELAEVCAELAITTPVGVRQ
jgi:hypothetical protein